MSEVKSSAGLGKGMRVVFGVVAPWTGMGVDSGTTTGDDERTGRDNAVLQGRNGGSMIKKQLELCFKIEENVFII